MLETLSKDQINSTSYLPYFKIETSLYLRASRTNTIKMSLDLNILLYCLSSFDQFIA